MYRDAAIEWIRSNRLDAIQLYFQKFINYFNFRNELGTASESSNTRDIIMLMTYGPLLMLFILRMVLISWLPLHRIEVLLVLLYLANAFVTAVFVTRIRYRLPFDFLMIIIVAILLERIFWQGWRHYSLRGTSSLMDER